MTDHTTVVYTEIEGHRKIWAAEGPRLGAGTPGEPGITKLLEQTTFRTRPTSLFAQVQAAHDQVVTAISARAGEGSRVWSLFDEVLRIAVLKYRGAEAEAAAAVRQLERRLPQ